MNAYAEILKIMRNEGKKDNPPPVQVGIMQDSKSCLAGELLLSSEDLLAAEHLTTGYHYAVNGKEPPLKDKSTFIEPLKKDDYVVLLKLNSEKYIILERLVGL